MIEARRRIHESQSVCSTSPRTERPQRIGNSSLLQRTFIKKRRSGEFEVFGATTAFLGPVDRALGGLAAQRGENQESVRLLTQAMAQCERMEAWPWWVWSGTDLASQLVRIGQRAQGSVVAELVTPRAEALGMNDQRQRLAEVAS